VGDDNGVPVDPGWRDAWVGVLWVPTMFLFQWRIRRSKLPALLLSRRIFVMFATSLILFGSVLQTLGESERPWTSKSAVVAGLVIAAFGLVALFAMRKFVDPPIPCGDLVSLAAAYRSRFFLRMAFANAPASMAFAYSFVTGRGWVYFFGLIPAAVGYVHAAPTRVAIEREWRDLDASGCHVNLLAALMTPPHS
jgi:hypothetical protein